jgi:3-methylcrotonyl-CoA carboxylase alpha subunit
MIAKLIAHGESREAALERLLSALDRTVIAGPRSNVAFLAALCRTAEFRQGTVDTGFIDRNLDALGAVPHGPDLAAAALGVAHLLEKSGAAAAADLPAADLPAAEQSIAAPSPWNAKDGFQLGGVRALTIPIMIDGERTVGTVTYGADGTRVAVGGAAPATDAQVFEAGDDAYVLRRGRQTRVRLADFTAPAAQPGAGDGAVKAPMHGRVLEVLVAAGDRVEGGQRLAVIEAMKMEHTLRAPFAGVVTEVPVAAGAQVVEGAEIVVIAPSAAL